MYWLGVDVGGTFTDLVLYDEAKRRIRIEKVPSTPSNQVEGVMNGIEWLSVKPGDLARIVHGTTVATNTALEMNGAKIAVLATAGHKDVVIVGRGNRLDVYNIKARQKPPMVPRSLCLDINERLNAKGEVLTPLDEAQVEEIAVRLGQEGVEAIAICFLHSYLNPTHETRCAEIIMKALPGVVIATSSNVLPEYREYERFATTAVNAYVAPRMRRYLGDLQTRLVAGGLRSPLQIMTSNGGSLPAERIHDLPVLTMLSGPAAGVIAASYIGELSKHGNLITCDIGGTSSDVCLVRGTDFEMTTDGRVGALPIKIRQIDIHTVAIGGGSIAASSGGFLSVGPRSAGSRPGPACYGRGGVMPTITDANVVLGRLSTDRLLGHDIKLDLEAARAAVGKLAEALGLGIEQMAEGILRLATISLAAAIKEVSIMRGHDPREFGLLPYGGAGPLQAVDVAIELGMDSVVIPPLPGTFSALGLLISDARRDYVQTDISALSALSVESIREQLGELVRQGNDEFDALGFPIERRRFSAILDLRYAGQSFELSVPVPLEFDCLKTLREKFEELYVARFGGISKAAIEVVSYRIVVLSISEKPQLPEIVLEGRSLDAALSRRRMTVFDGQRLEVPIYNRDLLPLNVAIPGPMLIEESGSTTVVPPNWVAELELNGCIVIRNSEGKS